MIYFEFPSNSTHSSLIKKYSYSDVRDLNKSEDRAVPLSFRPPFDENPMTSNYSRFGLTYTADFTQEHRSQLLASDEKETSRYLFMLLFICKLTDDD